MRKYSEDDALNSMMPARQARVVTPDDDNDLPNGTCDVLWINDEGVVNVTVIASDDTDPVTFTVTGPGPLVVRTKRVMEATTATDIVALY